MAKRTVFTFDLYEKSRRVMRPAMYVRRHPRRLSNLTDQVPSRRNKNQQLTTSAGIPGRKQG